MNLCIIPARSGSKRVFRKNIKNFCGKPIILWSIETAIKSKCFDKIIVSSDEKEIINLVKSEKVEVPFVRPKELADDYTGTLSVVQHSIEWFFKKSYNLNFVCCLYATAPFVQIEYLKKAMKILKKNKENLIFAATDYSHPVQRSFKILKNNKIEMIDDKYINSRTQDLEKTYHDAGQFYLASANTWLKSESIISPNSLALPLDRKKVYDIDTLDDWIIAENIFKSLENKK